jgi:hypothetical protein
LLGLQRREALGDPGDRELGEALQRGDWRGFCETGVKTSVARYFVSPVPSRVIATPETM